VTIGNLSGKALLNIFFYYVDTSPRFWFKLVHVCRRWRRIILTSQQTLHLQLYFTNGKPVSKTLSCWSALPIAVQYGGSPVLDPPAPEDEDNVMAALAEEQSDRVTSISLTVTSSLLAKLSSITGKRSFSKLEDLTLLSESPNNLRLTLPRTFQWGPPLRRLYLTSIAFPALLQLLENSRNLVDLQLHDVFDSRHFSPEELTNALSRMAQLQSFSLHFFPTASYTAPPPHSGERVVLPVLSRLNFRGFSKYLEGLLAGIDAPHLGDIEATFFNTEIVDLSKIIKFISRIEMHKSHRQAHILSSEHAISISLTQPGVPTCLKLQLLCKSPSVQLFSIARICLPSSAFLLNVEDLYISATRPPGWKDPDRHSFRELWLEPINLFTGVKWFHVAGNLSTEIVGDLQQSNNRGKSVLPALHKLYIAQPEPRHAPLREATVSFMTSRRLSGRPIMVEYEQPCLSESLGAGTIYSQCHRRYSLTRCGVGSFSQQGPIGILSDDDVLSIFRQYLDAQPRFWPTLASVCKRWRQIVLTSPLGLNLRLYCTYGTPVLKALTCWPALPIIVRYGGVPNLNPPAPEDDDNIIAALQQSGRVSSISLTVTNTLVDKLSAVSEAFSELEELTLLFPDNTQLSLPSTFRWGPRLRSLRSTRIGIPSFPQLLSPCHDLVDLQLHEIPGVGYFSPEAFANALSGMTHLRTFSLHFLSFLPRRNYLSLPLPSGERVVLPALMSVKYRGTSKYLDSLVARIDAPRLEYIDIAFFSQPSMDASQLGRFIERIEIQTPLRQADIQTSVNAISISFTDSSKNSSTSAPLRLQISCTQLDWQLSSMAQVCNQFYPFLLRVEDLGINTTQTSSGQEDVDGEQWLELVRSFAGAKDVRLTGVHVTDILGALRLADQGDTASPTPALPALRNLRAEKIMEMHGSLWDAVQSFITPRSFSGRPIEFNAPSYQCHICHSSSGHWQQQGLKRHLVVQHAYQVVCSYCGDFECRSGDNDLFREHLENKHPEVTRNDALITNPFSRRFPFFLELLVNRHSSLRAPKIVAPSTTVSTPSSQ
jgi:hypothetical protein